MEQYSKEEIEAAKHLSNEAATAAALHAVLLRMKAVAGMLAIRACVAIGAKPDQLEDYDRFGVRIDYGEPVPDETLAEDGATIYRRALVIIRDQYLFAEVQLVYKPGAQKLTIRGLVGDIELAHEVDPGNQLMVEWMVRRDLVDSRPTIY